MSYGHAHHLARSSQHRGKQPPSPASRPPETTPDPPGILAPDWYTTPELVPILTGRDIGALYRWLNKAGVPQRRIAALTGTTQPQVADIISGRRSRVMVYDVLARTAEGLGIPRERMGLSFWGSDGTWYGPAGTYPGRVTVSGAPKRVSPEMLRRHLIAFGGVVLTGVPVAKLGERLDDLGELPPVSLPSQLNHGHVMKVRDMTRRLAVGDIGCADPEIAAASVALATRLLDVPGPDTVTRTLRVAVAELRIEAGWAAFDAGLYPHALHHYARALELATDAGDAYCQAIALGYAGLACIEHGHPNDGLKLKQVAQVATWGIPSDEQRAVVVGEGGKAAVEACQLVSSAIALAALGEHAEAARAVARGRDLWTPTPADPFGDPDRTAAALELQRGRLDLAHSLAVASLRRWDGGRQLSRTKTGIVLAAIHVKAGEPRGLQLAYDAITNVTKLTSVRARRQLTPLVEALETRPGTDAEELARKARQVAAA
jgi:transcriptional regulator with XRE-family HTH domain